MHKRNPQNAGSALLVTILITSVVLILAIALLERIFPYSKQIHSMQNSLQAYYVARSEVEKGRLDFKKHYLRQNKDPGVRNPGIPRRILDENSEIIELRMPNLNVVTPGEHVIIARNKKLPSQIKLFKEDTEAQVFGTSNIDSRYHFLTPTSGGTVFNWSGLNVLGFNSLVIDGFGSMPLGRVKVTMDYRDIDTGERQLFWEKDLNSGINLLSDTTSGTLKYFFDQYNCYHSISRIDCFLKFQVLNNAQGNHVQITGSVPLPDLNAVLVADGQSGIQRENMYHSRQIEIIPTSQEL